MGFMRKADFELYRDADKHYNQVLTTRDFLALGVGTIISTSIFTLPGQVAAQFAGPGVVFFLSTCRFGCWFCGLGLC